MLHTDKGEDMQLIRQITDHISFKGEPQMTVEAIQDAVELELMNSSRKDVAQKYIAYRNQRSVARKAKPAICSWKSSISSRTTLPAKMQI